MDRSRPGRDSIARLGGLVLAVVLLSAMPGGVTGVHRDAAAASAATGSFRTSSLPSVPSGLSASLAGTAATLEAAGEALVAAADAAVEEHERRDRAARARADAARRNAEIERWKAELEHRQAVADLRRVELEARAKAAAEERAQREAARYRGRNHFWYPALGIDRPVDWFPCDRARPPDSPVYRWGCAGTNNVYLLAHAWSWFEPLNEAYYAGTLESGQLVAYADANGRTRFYRLDWWKVWEPLPSAKWAWAAQSTSSLTLQTCVGANSELRLFVRFREVPRP